MTHGICPVREDEPGAVVVSRKLLCQGRERAFRDNPDAF